MQEIRNKKGVLVGYEIDNILIHNYVHDVDYWYLTIRSLGIVRHRLCSKDLSKKDIAIHIEDFLLGNKNKFNRFIEKVSKFT